MHILRTTSFWTVLDGDVVMALYYCCCCCSSPAFSPATLGACSAKREKTCGVRSSAPGPSRVADVELMSSRRCRRSSAIRSRTWAAVRQSADRVDLPHVLRRPDVLLPAVHHPQHGIAAFPEHLGEGGCERGCECKCKAIR